MRISDYSCKYFVGNDILNSFLADARKYKKNLTPEEEDNLLKQYRENNDQKAKDKLILHNLLFIYSLAKIYARNEDEVMDYVNEGVVGLEKSIKKFDATKGTRFLTYGVWYIRREMNYYMLRSRDLVSHSAQVGNVIKKSDAVSQRYFAEHGHAPSSEELKKLLLECYGINVNSDSELYDSILSSIDQDIDDDYTVEDTTDFNDKTASYNEYENTVEQEYFKDTANAYLSTLNKDIAHIIRLRFGIGEERAYSPEEIGEMLNVLPERIEKICELAISQMRAVKVPKLKKIM